MMSKSMWALFGVSLFCLILGFVLVLLFISTIIVPSVANRQHLFDQYCLVIDIHTENVDIKGDSLNTVIPLNQDLHPAGNNTNWTSYGYDGYMTSSCFMIRVEILGGISKRLVSPHTESVKEGLLLPKDTEDILNPQHKCFTVQSVVSKNSGNSTSILYGGRHIGVGDIIQCSLSQKRKTEDHPIRKWKLLNAMFWPTFVFISGFVGLFFTSILLAKDGWKLRANDDNRPEAGISKY